MEKINVIYILGQHYCGSTLLGYQMGSLANCASMGEIYNWAFRDEVSYGKCSSCQQCKYITPELRETLAIKNVYQKYAELFGVTNLIDCSKVISHFRDKVLPEYSERDDVNIIPLILFRDPLEFFASIKVRKRKIIPDEWGLFYGEALAMTATMDNRIVLSYEDFVENNELHLQMLCGLIGEDYDPAIIKYWNHEHHQLGGNNISHLSINEAEYSERLKELFGDKIYNRERAAYCKKISYMEKAHEVLTPDEINKIQNQEGIYEVLLELDLKEHTSEETK